MTKVFLKIKLTVPDPVFPLERQNAAAESRCVEAIGTRCVAALEHSPVACRLTGGSATGCAKSARLYFKAI